jgi:geranylgeranyl reductase family protein
MNKKDVIICGAGPAGSSLAYFLSREGFDVLLLDKMKFPRVKPCAGAIQISLSKFFHFSLEQLAEDKATGISFIKDSRHFSFDLGKPMSYIVDRKNFDNFLLEKAVSCGAEFIEECKVLKFEDKTVYCNSGKFSGRILVGADGVSSVVRRFGEYRRIKKVIKTISADIPFVYKKKLTFDLSYTKGGYAWIFPKGDKVNVGWGASAGSFKEREAQFFRILDGYGFPMPLNIYKWVYPVFTNPESLTWKNTLLIGDAASLVNPATGGGIYNAIQSAYFASKAISGNLRNGTPLKNYQDMVRKHMYLIFYASRVFDYMIRKIPFTVPTNQVLRPILTYLAENLM